MVDLGVSGTKITAVVPGLYLLVAMMAFSANVTGARVCQFAKNGVALQDEFVIQAVTAAGVNTRVQASTMQLLGLGEYMSVRAYQNSGGSLNTAAGSFCYAARLATTSNSGF
jgi:hypothetical protein